MSRLSHALPLTCPNVKNVLKNQKRKRNESKQKKEKTKRNEFLIKRWNNVRRSTEVIFVHTPVHCSFHHDLARNNTVWHTFRVNPGARSRSQSKDWTTNTANSRLSRWMSRTHPSVWFRPSIRENRSITEILAKARVNTQVKGKANKGTWSKQNNFSLLKQPQQCWPLLVATTTRAWTWCDLELRHGDWYTVDTRRTLWLQKWSVGHSSTITLTNAINFLMSLLFPWNRRSKSWRKISLECKLTIMSCRSCIHDPWTNIRRSFVTNTMRSRRPWRICRSYNIRQSRKRKLAMNSSCEKSCPW